MSLGFGGVDEATISPGTPDGETAMLLSIESQMLLPASASRALAYWQKKAKAGALQRRRIPGNQFQVDELMQTWKNRRCSLDRCTPDKAKAIIPLREETLEQELRQRLDKKKTKLAEERSQRSGTIEETSTGLTADDLRGTGILIDDVAECIFQQMQDVPLPNFMNSIEIDEDGGLDHVSALWTRDKHMWALVALGSAIFNVYTLLSTDWIIFISLLESMASVRSPEDFNTLGAAIAPEESRDIFKGIHDVEVRHAVLSIATFVAVFEVIGLFWHFLQAMLDLHAITLFGNDREYEACIALYDLFRIRIPRLTVYSALKAAANIHPSLLFTIWDEWYAAYGMQNKVLDAGLVILFILSRIAILSLVLGAFSVKLVAVALLLIHSKYSLPSRVASVIALLNNCIGVILLDAELQERIFLFVFGGDDAAFQDSERALKYVFLARLAKAIRSEFWDKGSRWQAIAILATLDHWDLQKLLIQKAPGALQSQLTDPALMYEASTNTLRSSTTSRARDTSGTTGSTAI